MHGEERDGGRNPAVAVGDDGLGPVLGYAGLTEFLLELFLRSEGATLLEETIRVQVRGAGYMARASTAACYRAGVLARVASVEDQGVAVLSRGEDPFGGGAPFGTGARGEGGWPGAGHFGGGRAALGGPLLPSAVEDGDAVVAVVGEGPPQTGCKLGARVVVDDYVRVVRYAQGAHEGGEAFGRS